MPTEKPNIETLLRQATINIGQGVHSKTRTVTIANKNQGTYLLKPKEQLQIKGDVPDKSEETSGKLILLLERERLGNY